MLHRHTLCVCTSAFRPLLLFNVAIFCLLSSASATSTIPASDPQALTLAAQAITALTGGTVPNDVTISGTILTYAGSDQQGGGVMLRAKGIGESRVDLNLNTGLRIDVRNNSSGVPLGTWTAPDGSVNYYAPQNCWSDTSWFFLEESSLLGPIVNPNVVLSYVGTETRNGSSVQHIQSNIYVPAQQILQPQSTMDFYLDATSSLPVAVVYNEYPDDDPNTAIPIEIDFLNYQSSGGMQVPLRIQRLVQNDLFLDVSVTSVTINSGLPDSLFTIQ